MLLSVQRSEIFNEFTPEEQEYWFSIKEKAVAHHVDTLYYSVSLKDDKVNTEDSRLFALLEDLEALKNAKRNDMSTSVDFQGLQVCEFGGGQIYVYRLQMPEKYDVYFARNIINDDTPRIQVQLRTHTLVMDGLYPAIEESVNKVIDILTSYNLEVGDIYETRIDYAFHTNCIQKPIDVIGTESLNKHLLTCFSRFGVDGKIAHRTDEDLNIDYMTLGSRKSNYLFFRAYEKSKEVVQMNYKAFFFQKWLDRGLISRYDQYVYEFAYKLGSYDTGVIVGRVKWYLEHGKNDERKAELADLLSKYYENSSNNNALSKAIKGILPPTTLVFNIEFETKRKFYTYYNRFIGSYQVKLGADATTEAKRLYQVLGLRREFLDKLFTRYVSFVDDRRVVELKEQDWWRRIRCCRIQDVEDDVVLEAWREYSRRVDINRQRVRIAGSVANISMLYRDSADGVDFAEDVIDALSFLNDNDMVDLSGLKGLNMPDYKEVKARKARQLKPILKKLNFEKNEEDGNLSEDKKENTLTVPGACAGAFAPDELTDEQLARLDRATGELPEEYSDPHYFGDAWRCIRCSSVKYGDKELYKTVNQISVYPYYEGICKRCQRIFGKRK